MANWWDKVTRAVGRSRDIVVVPQNYDDDKSSKAVLTEPVWVSAPIYGSPRRIDYVNLEQYESDITVAAAVGFIMDSVATCEWNIVPDEDIEGETVPDPADAIKFFNSEDWEDSFEAVLRGVIADILHYDCGTMVVVFPEFCYDEHKTLTKTGVAPLQLRARDGRSFMRQVTPHGDIIAYWQYSFAHQATAPIEFTSDEIIYVQEKPSTRSPYGTSKLEIVQNVTDLMMATQLGHRSEQENAMQVGGVINHPDIVATEELKRRSEIYNSQLKGEHNKGRWIVTGGAMTVVPISANVGDNTWIGGSEWYQMQILSIFKVPKTVLGFTDASTNRATSISQATTFKRMGVSTMMTLLERVFTREIVKKYFNEKLVFRFVREVDLTDEAIRADIDAKNVATGVRTVNELRTRDGLEEIEEPEPEEEMSMLPNWSEYESEYHEGEGETPEEKAEKSVGRVWVKPSAKRKGHWRTTKPGETKGTPHQMIEDSLLFGVERYVETGEKKLQEIDIGLGIDPKIGETRRKSAKSERAALTQISGRGAAADHFEYMAGVKGLLEKGDIEKKKGGGFKLTKQGKARMKETDAAVVRHFKNVPTKSEGAKAQQKALSDQYMRMVEYNARRFKPKED